MHAWKERWGKERKPSYQIEEELLGCKTTTALKMIEPPPLFHFKRQLHESHVLQKTPKCALVSFP